jgi:hypothetical protein
MAERKSDATPVAPAPAEKSITPLTEAEMDIAGGGDEVVCWDTPK